LILLLSLSIAVAKVQLFFVSAIFLTLFFPENHSFLSSRKQQASFFVKTNGFKSNFMS